MSADPQKIPTKILDELCSRFIINIPAEQRDDLVRVFFAVELAHWYFLDFYYEDDTDLPKCHMKDFAEQVFRHCPFLRHHVDHLDGILSEWREYKFSVPTYGAILLDPSFEHMLLVRGFYNRESWGFPKGKVQENEGSLKCAIREVIEEVGYDIKDRSFEDQYLERELNGQIIRLYIVKNVPLDTKFATKTKNEIKDIRWFPLADLPTHRRDATPQMNLNINVKAFFMVIPFMKDLRRWINQERGLASSSNGADSDPMNESMKQHDYFCSYSHHLAAQQVPRRRTKTYHGDTHSHIPPLPLTTFVRHEMPFVEQPKRTGDSLLQKQLSIQDTVQQHFSQILKNDSIRVTDKTTITETSLMGGNNSVVLDTSRLTQLTPPASNDEENRSPNSTKVGGKTPKKGPARQKKNPVPSAPTVVQYRILARGQVATPPSAVKANPSEEMTTLPARDHPSRTRKDTVEKDKQPLLNITNETASLDQPFGFRGPLCWTQFRLNRSEVIRCLRDG